MRRRRRGSFYKSRVCSLPQSTTTTSKKKSVWCSLSQSVCIVFVLCICPTVPHPTSVSFTKTSLPCSRGSFPLSLLERGDGRRSRRGEESGAGRRMSHQCLRCGLSEAFCRPQPASAFTPRTSGRCSTVRKSGSGGGVLCGGERRRLALPVPCVQLSAYGPPSFAPPLEEDGDGEHREDKKEKTKQRKRWFATMVIVWLDCFGQSWATDWGCSCLGGLRWAGRQQLRSPDLLSSPASPE